MVRRTGRTLRQYGLWSILALVGTGALTTSFGSILSQWLAADWSYPAASSLVYFYANLAEGVI